MIAAASTIPTTAIEIAIAPKPCSRYRLLEILLSGASTRNYAKVLPEMAESVGISSSAEVASARPCSRR